MDASAAAAARAREVGQHQSQLASNAYSAINGGAYGHHQTSSYSPRERQHDTSSSLGQGAFGAYGGYTSSGASNNVSSMTTDALYGMSNYSGGSMTPNRQSYEQYTSHASTARSAPGSPYSGMSRHSNNLTCGMSAYSLFPNSGTVTSSNNVGTRSSQASMAWTLSASWMTVSRSARTATKFYGARGYQQPSSAYSASQQTATSSSKWPSSARFCIEQQTKCNW